MPQASGLQFTATIGELPSGRTRYQLVIRPPLWRLELMHNSRMFQNQGTDAIVRTLLEERGIVDSVFD
ncbi:contractile injection system protein, VgrG/Pvc8 family, partial [uncultured Marinobacter sp.]